MKEAADPAPSGTSSVPAALLDYFEAPGKYQLTLRQPAVLFRSIREILQLASGRGPEDAPQSQRLREAANFFIRAALLYPGADHYAVLGLPPGDAAGDLKERYRLLMRLIHPDFAAGANFQWPEDAAVRVNRAYEVLSSAVLRREYDDELATLRARRPAPPQMAPSRPRAVAARPPSATQRRFGKRTAWALAIAALVPAAVLMMPGGEPAHLVQRAPAPRKVATPIPVAPAQDATPAPLSEPEPTPAPGLVAHAAEAARPAAATSVASGADSPQRPEHTAPLPRAQDTAAPTRPLAPVTRQEQAATPAAGQRMAPPAPAMVSKVAAATPLPPAPAVAAAPPRPVLPVVDVPVATSPPPQAPLAAPVAAVAPAGRLTTTLSVPPVPVPTLNDAQPILTQMLQMLESGSGDQLLRLLDGDARNQAGAQALSRKYEQLVKGGRPIHVADVEFSAEPREGLLLVTGRVRLHAGEPTIGSFGQKLVLRAEFVQRAGKTQLNALSSASD